MNTLFQWLFLPERSGLKLALWLARIVLVLSYFQLARAAWLYVSLLTTSAGQDPLANQLTGAMMMAPTRNLLVTSLALLIGAHVAVGFIAWLGRQLANEGNPAGDESGA